MAVRTRTSASSVVMTIFGVIAAVLVLGILLVLIGANQHNTLVDFVLDIGRFFARPFNHLLPQHTAKQDMTVNWGIGALAYLLVGSLLARLVYRA
ncbi:MAG: hypothetical protein V7637_1177 [Mycobacteriales bacterium]|jgi:hypothetical protein